MYENGFVECNLFNEDYKHKIYLLGFLILNVDSEEACGKIIDIYLKSHEYYYKLSIDFIYSYTTGVKDRAKIDILKFNEFKYLRPHKNVIMINENNVLFPELLYNVYKTPKEIFLKNSNVKNNNEVLLGQLKSTFFISRLGESLWLI